MKIKLISIVTLFILVISMFSGCVSLSFLELEPVKIFVEELQNSEATPSATDNAEEKTVFKYSDKELKTSYGEKSINYRLNGDSIEIVGNVGELNAKYVLVDFLQTEEEYQTSELKDGCFSLTTAIPESMEELTVNLFYGAEAYGNFESIIHDYIKIENVQGEWTFKTSPVLEENVNMFIREKDIKKNLKKTRYIQSENDEIINLSSEITKDCLTDYEKALKIHDWVAENIYYDYDAIASGDFENSDALNVLHSKRAVCEGYANLFAALARAQNIPCAVQCGYALGLDTDREWSEKTLSEEANHAWNEVFVDDRWIIIDATWDSKNEIKDGQMVKGNGITHVYFDSDIVFFSLSHKFMER